MKTEPSPASFTILPHLVYLWQRYSIFVVMVTRRNSRIGGDGIAYWRDKLFTSFITYLLPFSIIALVPGVIMSIKEDLLFIAVFDLFVPVSIACVVFTPKFSLVFKKVFVVFILYSLAIMLLVFLGLFGPGVIYLLALSIFITLIFTRSFAYGSVIANLLVCIGCGLIIHYKLFNSPLVGEYSVGAWIAVSSNLVFLSWVSVALVRNTIQILEKRIRKELHLKSKLLEEAREKLLSSQRLKESEDHYKSLFYNNPAPMWVLDLESLKFLQVNEAAIRRYGYTNEEFLALTINDIKMEGDISALHTDLKTNLQTGAPLNIVTRHRCKNKEEFPVEVRFNIISFKGSFASLVIIRDITEQVAYVNAIEKKNERLREIAYIQSHHVRAPLARILGLVDLIVRNPNEDQNAEFLSYLYQSANDLDNVIKDITNYTQGD